MDAFLPIGPLFEAAKDIFGGLTQEQAITLGWVEFISAAKGLDSLDETAKEPMALGVFYTTRFHLLRAPEAITAAIDHFNQAMMLTPDTHPAKPTLLYDLASSYQSRFESFGDFEDINNAVEYHGLAVLLTPDDHTDRPDRLNRLGTSYRSRFQCLGEIEDVNKAINYHRQAMLLLPEGHANKAGTLNELGIAHQCRSDRLHDLADIDTAIDFQRQAMQLAPDIHRATWLDCLGISYQCRFEHLGELADIDKAIDHHTQAVLFTPDGLSGKERMLNHLGSAYRFRFQHHGEAMDLENAISYHSQAMLSSPDDHNNKPGILSNLGNTYRCRFQCYGKVSDVDKAIEYHTQSVLLTRDGHAEKPSLLNNLAASYRSRFLHSGQLSDFDRAIDFQNQAILLIPDDYTKSVFLGNLGDSYQARFRRSGELSDIDMAINYKSRPVLLIPDSDAAKPAMLSSLANSYQARFERYGEFTDLKKAIDCHTQAVLLTPDGHASKPGLLSSLGVSYRCRFELHSALDDLSHAIDYQRQAVLLTPNSHYEKAGRLSNLGNSYQRRFLRYNDLADIDKAIECQSQSVMMTPDDRWDKPGLVSNLGNSYSCRFERLGELADIDMAVECQGRAVLLTPEGYADKSVLLILHAEACVNRYICQREQPDLETANGLFHQAAQRVVTNPSMQFYGVRKWAKSLLLLGISPQPAYQRAMELMPQLIWLGTTIDQRYHLLTEVGDLAMEAAAWATSVKSFELAVEWLEQGRSVVWNQILQLRTPFDELLEADPPLAQRLKDISSELERAGSRSKSMEVSPFSHDALGLEQEAQHHHRLATEWDQLLQQVHRLPGFHDFMRPPKANTLARAAKDGPLVIINVHLFRCDALIILPNSSDVAHVALENFSMQKAIEVRAQLMSLIGQRGGRPGGFRRLESEPKPKELFRRMLATLWSDVVKPILDFLGYSHEPSINALPHVTWCTTGAVSFLPLHAAGCYDGSQPNAFDLVVSSYTPTLGALLASATTGLVPDAHTGGFVAVGQEQTTGFSELPYTVLELAAIQEYVEPSQYIQLDGNKATVAAVLNAMDKSSWVHFACHATQDISDPTQSAFHLHDGNLTLAAITKRAFKHKGLAFLSACQTATGDQKLPDEAIHLAAGMLMAGYPSVIATMWGIVDEDAPEVARQVYADLLKDGKMDYTGASRALHEAVAGLREKVGEESFERWVPFVHIGV